MHCELASLLLWPYDSKYPVYLSKFFPFSVSTFACTRTKHEVISNMKIVYMFSTLVLQFCVGIVEMKLHSAHNKLQHHHKFSASRETTPRRPKKKCQSSCMRFGDRCPLQLEPQQLKRSNVSLNNPNWIS